MTKLLRNLDAVDFTPTRAAGLHRMEFFQSNMGRTYAGQRNHDFGPHDRRNVSALSPWVRTRTLLEEELVRTALDRHAYSTAEKFVREVCWRTYWKGWLEQRPGVWTVYRDQVRAAFDALDRSGGQACAYRAAVEGRTGIACFDAWVRELVSTGYIHNHARMWFASIWVYTLDLPWVLGADFFIQHLMDGDAASNTLSWRWVCGLHTPGKTYLARTSNISEYTNGRFSPEGLAREAPALAGFSNPAAQPLPVSDGLPDGPVGLLLTEEDLNGETLCPAGARVKGIAGFVSPNERSPQGAGGAATAFAHGALRDALARAQTAHGAEAMDLTGESAVDRAFDWALGLDVPAIVTGYPPVGWVAPQLDTLRARLAGRGVALVCLRRDWDEAFWPHARKGFFGLRKQIPSVLAPLGLPI